MAKLVLDMSQEKGYLNDLLPEGLQLVGILEAKPEKSAKGDDFIVTTIMSVKTGAQARFWLALAQGKRWLLKSLLEATGLYKKNSEGRYEVETDNLIGVEVGAFIVHEDDTYRTKDEHEAKKKKSIIKRFVKKEEIEKK